MGGCLSSWCNNHHLVLTTTSCNPSSSDKHIVHWDEPGIQPFSTQQSLAVASAPLTCSAKVDSRGATEFEGMPAQIVDKIDWSITFCYCSMVEWSEPNLVNCKMPASRFFRILMIILYHSICGTFNTGFDCHIFFYASMPGEFGILGEWDADQRSWMIFLKR